MTTWLVLDVDGVVLDADRAGDGHWTNELERRHGITRAQLRDAFFAPHWHEIVTGRRPIGPTLEAALRSLHTTVDVEDVLACWFEADFVPVDATVRLAGRVSRAGGRVAVATNQETRRAAYLRDRLAGTMPLDGMVASADVGHVKPTPAFFTAADASLGIADDDRVVFADDSPDNVVAAARHGWTAVAVTPPNPDWIAVAESALGLA